jgi:hypothetical protein
VRPVKSLVLDKGLGHSKRHVSIVGVSQLADFSFQLGQKGVFGNVTHAFKWSAQSIADCNS